MHGERVMMTPCPHISDRVNAQTLALVLIPSLNSHTRDYLDGRYEGGALSMACKVKIVVASDAYFSWTLNKRRAV